MSTEWFCVDCGKKKHSDGFPATSGARCWACTWDQHNIAAHPLSRSERREIRKFARNFAQSKAVAAARDRLAVVNLSLPPVGGCDAQN